MSYGDEVSSHIVATKVECPYLDSATATTWAKANGFEVTVPASNEIFIDIDDDDSLITFAKNRMVVETFLKITNVRKTISRSGNMHLYVTFERDISTLERIALQAALGSDLRGVAFQLRRHVENDPVPVLFFEKAPAAKRLLSFLGI